MSAPISGLPAKSRHLVRQRAVEAAVLSIEHAGGLHYTRGERRWEGIDQKLSAHKGQVPAHGDCSSTATWWLWNGLWLVFGARDTVNGQGWKAGYTGTMLQTGKPITHGMERLPGDLFIYGRAAVGSHVAMYLGGGMVASHGSEAGPFKCRWDYRHDLKAIRRAI